MNSIYYFQVIEEHYKFLDYYLNNCKSLYIIYLKVNHCTHKLSRLGLVFVLTRYLLLKVTLPMYWFYGPQHFCNIEDENSSKSLVSSNQPTVDDCTGSQLISVSTFGSLVLRYSPILSFNDLSNAAHMSMDDSSNRASLVRDSVRSLVIMINRQNFTSGICLNSALVMLLKIDHNNFKKYLDISQYSLSELLVQMLPYVEYVLEVFGTNILNQSSSKSQFKFKLIETHGIKPQPKLQIIARPLFAIGTEAIFETMLYPVCGEPIEDSYDNLQVKIIFIKS